MYENKMCPCKHLDYTEGEYTDCKIVEVPDFSCRVRYWERGERWTDNGSGEKPNPSKVQFCGQGRGRIKGIFQCYNPGEMPCYEPEELSDATLSSSSDGWVSERERKAFVAGANWAMKECELTFAFPDKNEEAAIRYPLPTPPKEDI